MNFLVSILAAAALITPSFIPSVVAQIAIRGETIHTMAGEPIRDGVVVVRDGTIRALGPASSTRIPQDYKVISARVVTPGLIDSHSVVGLSGILNQPQDQEQLEKSSAIQPELRAIDGYNNRDPLIDWVRSFGVTTLHTGHAPGALVSGQTMIVKTAPADLSRAILVSNAMIAVTLGPGAMAEKGKAPGTSSKAVAMLRSELLRAREYARKISKAKRDEPPARDLRLEALVQALDGKAPLLITAHRHQDILAALRIGAEFKLKVVLDGAADAHLLLKEIKKSGYPVVVHATMARASEETENLGMETASKLKAAGIPFALQSGYESYVPKTRVVLLEAGVAAANGLTFQQALAAVTIDAAKILGIDGRVGSLERGKSADLALYDGDPFEYTSHCVGVVVSGVLTETQPR
ncbi:MAG TPA: amidohydrolase family protein [Verrucomicrobiae bacterium]|nr:amidohydrolase family protein [Verrucomicrobiae bacterium]